MGRLIFLRGFGSSLFYFLADFSYAIVKGVGIMTILKKVGMILANTAGGLGAAVAIYLVLVGVYATVEPERMAHLLKGSVDNFEKYK